jgi:thiamine pyrophosphokinase
MSSHHVVRDKQEPALILANGEACSKKLLDELLEWSPYIVVLDGAIHRVLEMGIKADVLLGDFDRNELSFDLIRQKQDYIEIVHTPNQDKTDLEKAIDFLIEKGHKAATIVWATGRRADHTFANIANLARYRDKIVLTIVDDYSTIYLLPKKPASFSKWYPTGTILSLMPLGKVTGLQTRNLRYNLQREELLLGFRNGNSNEVLETGIVEISYDEGDLLMFECQD